MTSDEINQKTFHVDGMREVLMLKEIAFQLARLNEHFEKVDGAVFGGTNEKKSSESGATSKSK